MEFNDSAITNLRMAAKEAIAKRIATSRDNVIKDAARLTLALCSHGVLFELIYDAYCVQFRFNGVVHSRVAERIVKETIVINGDNVHCAFNDSFGNLILKWS